MQRSMTLCVAMAVAGVLMGTGLGHAGNNPVDEQW